ncbi:MAG: response regulator [Desulfuromonadaceae bacterium]|nr:response regulator [Desulfuromonadaceae bacterium]
MNLSHMPDNIGGTQNTHILFVDDEQAVLSSFRRLMRGNSDSWRCHYAASKEEALLSIRSQPIDIVVCDFNMPGKTGFDLLKKLRGSEATHDLPVLIMTGSQDEDLKRQALDMGATDLLLKPVNLDTFLARIRRTLKLKARQDEIKERNCLLDCNVKIRTRELEASRRDLIWRLAKTAEYRDSETGNHIFRVAHYCKVLAAELEQDSIFCEHIFQSSLLHDIGKIGIPDGILLKTGRLNEQERHIMERHCLIGAEMLSHDIQPPQLDNRDDNQMGTDLIPAENSFLSMASDIALCHHERWDGSGYPNGIAGETIPLSARICAVADVFDALSSERTYKKALPEPEVIAIMREGRGSQFDPAIFQCFENCLVEFRRVRNRLADT